MASTSATLTGATVLCVVFSALFQVIGANELSRGWGDKIDWVKFDEGLTLAQEYKKPLMLVIHKSWCGACRSLKPKFAESSEIEVLSKHFVMVNTEDDEEPKDVQFAPDGGYIPRIFFLDSRGKVRKDIYNEGGNESYKFYYYNAPSILSSMNKALDKIKYIPKQPMDEL